MIAQEPPRVGAHARNARTARPYLVRRWLRQGKVWLLPLLLSDYGRDLLDRKYDAVMTDRAYDVRPSGRLGPIGAAVDWIVLQQDIHVGLRQRLAIVVDELARVVQEAWSRSADPARLVSGPCGLARDLRLTWRTLGSPTGKLELVGLDLDSTGEVLPVASARAAAEGVPLRTARCDLLNGAAVRATLDNRPADVFLSIGLTVWLAPPELAALLDTFHQTLVPGGVLIVDNFHAHGASRFARDLEMETRYHEPAAFEAAVRGAGFTIEAVRETANRVNVVYRCRRA